MPRLFISHSSKDNIHALAFQRWLELKGWAKDDVFIDLHDMQAGERWRDTLVKANIACEALLFLASPEALASDECRREVRRAEDDRKDVIVAILRDLAVEHPGLADYKDRQIIDLSTKPLEERVEVEHKSQRHLIDFNRAALHAIHAKLIDWGIAPDAFAWPPRDNPKALPYPGLDAFDEHSTGIFFGREADIMASIRDLRQIRHRGSPRLLVIQAASGAGKSSLLRAGLWPRLGRTAEFVPLAVVRPATGIITGQHGLGQGLSRWFAEHRRQIAPGALHSELLAGDAKAGAERLAAHMRAAVALVAEERALNAAEGAALPRLSPLIAIDQGEELFAAEDARESDRFLDMLGALLASPPADLDPYVLVTIRADSVDALLQRVPALGIATPQTIMLPPLSPGAYRDVISKPAAVYTRQVARLDLEPELVETLVRSTTGADALPLLAFTLQRLFLDYAPAQTLTKAHYDAMGGIEGSIDRKLAEAKAKAGATGSEANLRRLIVPALATWDPAANAAKRLVPKEAEVLGGDRAGLTPLVKALVDARLLTRGSGTLEVAHEALLRRQPIAGWLEEQKDALKLRDDVLKEASEWAGGGKHAEGLVRRGARLEAALALDTDADFKNTLAMAEDYLLACTRQEAAGRRRARRTQAAIYTLMASVIGVLSLSLVGILYRKTLEELHQWHIVMQPTVLTAEKEREKASNPGPSTTFAECRNGCPTMVVIPAGKFMMGSADGDKDERPQHEVTIVKPFAVSRTEITFAEWDACVAAGGCPNISDNGWGRSGEWGHRPAILISRGEAKQYAAWLSKLTGQTYRLLSEAEWEYAARAGNSGKWSFGDDESRLGDHAWFNKNSNGKTQPVMKKQPNRFGLYDMHGNVWEWVEDCYDDNYGGAPTDGSAHQQTDCSTRVVRGGSWSSGPDDLRSAIRFRNGPDGRLYVIGFRVARVLSAARTP